MYDTLLVGVDGSDFAQKALEHAVELSQAVGATLHVITVVDSTANPMRFSVTEVDELNQAKATLIENITKTTGNDDITAEVRRGDPADALLAYAAEIDADLILVGQSGAGQLEATIFGRTTEQLAEQTQIPLTIVPLSNED
ncbi:UspA domain-containing protein [Natrialba hulunbeirensis JCM 10989]|uniref:UspA domain-containing protein n=1 Tax=Natrialba hulunbeirensis JCM 10989 TaxID=1227493 RepID=L9ZX65_9EURY|nr:MULTISPECIES: universal stress protein [Natrialba]ELY90187.1 UspA domain-containing protein [Natrialba hulunbeirensis JCM 10989]OIB55655.1 universal stress protein UspA [Natrialba sp. SSL1]